MNTISFSKDSFENSYFRFGHLFQAIVLDVVDEQGEIVGDAEITFDIDRNYCVKVDHDVYAQVGYATVKVFTLTLEEANTISDYIESQDITEIIRKMTLAYELGD